MCLLDPGSAAPPKVVTIKLPKLPLQERMVELAIQVRWHLHNDLHSGYIHPIVLEQPPYMAGRPGQAYVHLSMGVALGAALISSEFSEIVFVAPGTWKKVVCGNGNASKAEIKTAVLSAFPGLTTSQDAADAAGIALWFARRNL